MPHYREITVQVTNADNVPLREYGVRKRDRSRLTTCYIQSKTDMAFRIRIKSEIRFPPQMVDSEISGSPSDGKYWLPLKAEVDLLNIVDEISVYESGLPVQDHQRSGNKATPLHISTQSRPAPWHLLATLRLDGRQKVEKRSIIRLDDPYQNSNFSHREVIMRCRTVQDADGHLRDCGWLFKEVAIETVLQKINLLGDDDDNEAVPKKEDEDLFIALGSLDASLEDAEEKSTAGQIEVTLDRVTLGGFKYDYWEGREGGSTDIDMSANDMKDISHTVARDKGRRKGDLIQFIDYSLMDGEDQPYATFRFYYRSEDKLRKFDFPELASKTPAGNSLRQRKEALSKAAANPLSIYNSKPVRYCFNDKGEVIGEEGIPAIESTKSKEAAEEISSNCSGPWVPKHNKFPTITVREEPQGDVLDSPPGSPIRNDDSEDTATFNAYKNDLITVAHLRPIDPEQSSADESSPLKKISEKAKREAMTKFRTTNDETTEGEEADDEASDGGRSPNSMSFRDDTGDAVGDEADEISRDEPDGGISASLDNVQIGSKRISADESADEGVGIRSTVKKSKVTNSLSGDQEVENDIDEEL